MAIEILEHLEEIKEIQAILLELKRTADTCGDHCPYNKVYPHQAKIVYKIREILREEIEK